MISNHIVKQINSLETADPKFWVIYFAFPDHETEHSEYKMLSDAMGEFKKAEKFLEQGIPVRKEFDSPPCTKVILYDSVQKSELKVALLKRRE
jgi:hypothetical protein